MNHWSMKASFLALLFVIATLSACAPGQERESGSAMIGVSAQALSSSDVAKVTITISGANISPDIVQDLVKTGNQWKGIVGKIPVGTGRTFSAEAFDSGNNKIYEGSVGNITIAKGAPALVAILLQQSTPPTPFQNTVPDITALTASAGEIGNDEDVQLVASASDVDGDSLTYTWSATNGTFPSGNTGTSVTWRAPVASFTGNVTLNVEVADGAKGGKTGASVVIDVQPFHSNGKAKVSVTFNTWPEVSQMTSSNDPVDLEQSTTLGVTSSDADGDPLAYAWSATGAGCTTGSFDNVNIQTPVWTAPATAPASGTCTLVVTVTDGRGGQTTGTMTVNVGEPTVVNLAPKLITTFQSTDEADAGTSVEFRVVATDPEGTPLTFAWTDSSGPLTPNTTTGSDPYTSKLVWTKPAGTCGQTVTVVVTDADSIQTTHTFSVECTKWAQSVGSTGADSALAIAIDTNNSVYVAGYFSGTVNFGNTQLTASGEDIFVAKLNSAGEWLWAKRAGGAGNDRANAIYVDGTYVYLGGSMDNGATFATSPSTTFTTVGSGGFVARMTPNGDWDHVLDIKGAGDESVNAIFGVGGDIIATGHYTNGASFDMIPSAPTNPFTIGSVSQDVFVARMHASLKKWEWVKTAGGSGYDNAHSITFDSTSGNAYIAGTFTGTSSWGAHSKSGFGGRDIFVAAFALLDGTWQWVWDAGGTGPSEEGFGITSDGTDLYCTGTFQGTASFGGSNYTSNGLDDLFVTKLNASGAHQWTKTFGGTGGDNGVAIASKGSDLWVAGTFGSSITFGSLAPITSTGSDDAFLLKLSASNGTPSAVSKAGGSLSDAARSVAVDSNDKAYVVGSFQGSSAFFAPGTLSSQGGLDMFIWKP